jgi:ATP-dependent helicase/DNAse subunit B
MARHLQNDLARQGFVFSPGVIQTLSRFLEPWTAGVSQVSAPTLHMLIEKSVRRLNLPEFSKVAQIAGFHAKLASVIEECSAAGCGPDLLRRHLPEGGLGKALIQVFEEVTSALNERKLGMRAMRLSLAAENIDREGTSPVTTVCIDGFFSLTDPELAVVKAMAKHADVTVTLPSGDIAAPARRQLLAMGFKEQVLTHVRPPAKREVVVAPGIEREADEIARRILEEVAAGKRFREIGIILRSPEVYSALLRTTLERFGMPARFYFDSALTEQPAIRYLTGIVDAMLAGWDHKQTLTAMKLAPGVGVSAPMDRFDFDIRERLPGAGLEPLAKRAAEIVYDDKRLLQLLERFAELNSWRSLRLKPAQWSEQLARLRALYRPARPIDDIPYETALEWRSQASALDCFDLAVAEVETWFDPDTKISLREFWQAVETALQLVSLRVNDQRRDVVHVLSAPEARQWELPVVFVCGLVEGQFPQYHAPDPFLPELARRRLKAGGVRIRTAEDAEREEQFLFDSALSRATVSLVVSYPKNDARGEQNLRSLFLDLSESAVPSRPVRPETAGKPATLRSNGIRAADLLQIIREKHAEVRPTALESFLQCPFQFLGRHTLKLEGSPCRPEARLDFMVRGNIVHGVIYQWLQKRGPVDEIFEDVFRQVAQEESIPSTYLTELLRSRMRNDLRRFVECDRWPADYETEAEVACRFELDGGLGIRCRIDRLIKTPDGRAFVIDYKYSANARDKVTNQNLLQGPLYWMAAERGFQLRTAGMYYCSVRDAVEYAGWGERFDWTGKILIQPATPEWLQNAVERSNQAAQEISSGRIGPAPADLSLCRRCDFKDVCRFESAVAVLAEGV